MAKMIEIHSNVTINVTAGLQNKDVTNPDAHVADRLKVNPEWPRHTVLIRQGQHRYPEYIKEWPSVKQLAADKILTIGQTEDVPDDKLTDEEKKNAMHVQEAKEEFKMPDDNEGRRRRRRSLDEIAGEGQSDDNNE